MKNFKIFGTAVESEKSVRLDEISIISDSKTLAEIGVFFIKAASLMEENEIDHVHLQDKINGFDYGRHVDIVLLNKEIIKIKKIEHS